MRAKIILVNGTIVLVLALLCFFLLAQKLGALANASGEQNARLSRTLGAAAAQLSLDGLRLERFLALQARKADTRQVFAAGTSDARQEAATAEANRIRDAAGTSAALANVTPSLLLFVDATGVGLGRDGSELMRGDHVAEAYPILRRWLNEGTTGSDIWVSQRRQEQMFVSFAPVMSEEGIELGGLLLGMPLNDERMTGVARHVSGGDLALVVDGSPVAVGDIYGTALSQQTLLSVARGAREGAVFRAADGDWVLGAAPLPGFASDKAVLVATLPVSVLPNLREVLWPLLAVGVLGLLLVVFAAMALDNYISRPIAELEDGLLRVINGEEDLRFELEHDELGGLSTRINTLLNAVQGIHEAEASRTD